MRRRVGGCNLYRQCGALARTDEGTWVGDHVSKSVGRSVFAQDTLVRCRYMISPVSSTYVLITDIACGCYENGGYEQHMVLTLLPEPAPQTCSDFCCFRVFFVEDSYCHHMW
jgi:hypothetical protein